MKSFSDIRDTLNELFARVKRYLPALFACLVLGVYGFVVYRVNALNGATPVASSNSQTAQVPHIDPKLISQLQSLQDNSTSVQSLFDQARNNPFSE